MLEELVVEVQQLIFNINTVDARGFDELLTQSRGTITQLINQAVNERGAKSII